MAKECFFFNRPMYGGCAIYAIINRKRMRVYVGQTKNLKTRAKTHDEQLRKKTHANQYLQQDVDNGEMLDFITLLRMPESTTEEELKLLEKLFMLEFLNSGFELYNQTMQTRDNIMQNIILCLSMHYHVSEIISDEYTNKYNKHFCYDIEVLKNNKRAER